MLPSPRRVMLSTTAWADNVKQQCQRAIARIALPNTLIMILSRVCHSRLFREGTRPLPQPTDYLLRFSDWFNDAACLPYIHDPCDSIAAFYFIALAPMVSARHP